MGKEQVIRFGTFGPRGSGKTVSLAAMRILDGNEELELEITDKATIEYLRPLVELLERGEFPPATVAQAPDQLRWLAHVGVRRFVLECIDFAGELTDPVWNAGPEVFKQRVRDWFGRCDAVLLYVDSADSNSRYQDAIDWLLEELDSQSTAHGSRRRVVAVVMTKGDKITSSPADLRDPARVDQVLANHRVYQRVKRQLERKVDTTLYRLFLCSSVGWNFDSVPDKRNRRVEPANLVEALHWAVLEASKVVAATHEQVMLVAERRLRDIMSARRLGLPNYKRLIAELDLLDTTYQLHEGPLAAQVAKARAELVESQRRQRVAVRVMAVASLLTVLAAAWWVVRRGQTGVYEEFARIVREIPGDDNVEKRLDYFNSRIAGRRLDWLWGLRGHRRIANAQAEEDRRVLARVRAEDALALLLKEDEPLAAAQQHPRRHQRAVDYLTEHGEALPGARLPEVRRVLEETRPAWERDRKAWKEAIDALIQSPRDYGVKASRLTAYADRPDALSAKEAKEAVKLLTTQETADQQDYEAIRESLAKADSSDGVARLDDMVQAYLGKTRHAGTMSSAVQVAREGLNKLKQPRTVHVRVKSITITPNFLERTWTGYPKPSVTIVVGRSVHKTGVVTTQPGSDGAFRGTIDQTIGPFPAEWGKKQEMKVTVEIHRTFFSNETESKTIKDERSLLFHYNSPVTVYRTGGIATIELECGAVKLPALPAYGGP